MMAPIESTISGGRSALVLGGGIDQLALIDGLRRRGYRVVAVDADPNCPGRARADAFHVVSTIDEAGVLAVALREGVEVVGVISSDRPLRVAARINAEIGHFFPLTYEQAVAVTEKPRMKKTLEAAGVPYAKHLAVRDPTDIDPTSVALRFPLIAKPADSSASRGISFIRDPSEIPAAIHRATSASRSGVCVLEEYLCGQEISVDAVVLNGVAHILLITDGVVDRHPERFGLYLMNRAPTSISAAARAAVRDAVERVAAHVGVDNSLFFFQMMVDGDTPTVIEYSARNAGAAKSRFIRTVMDFDIVDLYLQILLGEAPVLPQASANPHATLNFLYGSPGQVAEWRGFEELVRDGVMAWYEKFKPEGARCEGVRSGADRLGVYALAAPRADELEMKKTAVEQRISILDSDSKDMLVRALLA